MKNHWLICLLLCAIPLCGQNYIVISKQDATLNVLNDNSEVLFSAAVSVGKNPGNKQCVGDCRTPEGVFEICQIQNSSTWVHDFNDGYGYRNGAYGPYFFRLKVPRFSGIGIHGTCFPEQINTRCSEGCIRLNNQDLLKLKKYVFIGMKCIIEKDEIF